MSQNKTYKEVLEQRPTGKILTTQRMAFIVGNKDFYELLKEEINLALQKGLSCIELSSDCSPFKLILKLDRQVKDWDNCTLSLSYAEKGERLCEWFEKIYSAILKVYAILDENEGIDSESEKLFEKLERLLFDSLKEYRINQEWFDVYCDFLISVGLYPLIHYLYRQRKVDTDELKKVMKIARVLEKTFPGKFYFYAKKPLKAGKIRLYFVAKDLTDSEREKLVKVSLKELGQVPIVEYGDKLSTVLVSFDIVVGEEGNRKGKDK